MIDILFTILAIILLLILPGLVLSYAFYLPGERILTENQSDRSIERLLLSAGLSLMIIPVTTYGLNYILSIGPNREDLILVLNAALLLASTALCIRLAVNTLRHNQPINEQN